MSDSQKPTTQHTTDELIFGLTRRQFMVGSMALGAILTLPILARAVPSSSANDSSPLRAATPTGPGVKARFRINGKAHELEIDPRTTVLDLVRERLDLTGTKKGCDHGQCGACTVLVDGRRVNSCMCLALQYQNKEITTIEGLAKGDQLHPMQEAFIHHDAFQCGFCTPGQIMSAVALLKEPCGSSENEVRECMSGNICRCGAYRNILAAIQDVRGHGKATKGAKHANV